MSDATHFCCLKCAEVFEKAEATQGIERYTSEMHGQVAYHAQIYNVCPFCESDELEDAWLCELCGIRRADVEGTDCCAVCMAEEEKLGAMWDQANETKKGLNV